MDNVTVPQTKPDSSGLDDLLGTGTASTGNSAGGSLLDIMAEPGPGAQA